MVLELLPIDAVPGGENKQKAADEMPVYRGPERRKDQRRTVADRREMVRFETKTDRRNGRERRNTLGLWKNRDF